MPFYTIDWTRYSNHSDVRGAVDASASVNELTRISLRIWKYTGGWFGYKLPKKYRWIRLCHKMLLLFLVLSTLVTSAMSIRYWRPLTLDIGPIRCITLTLVHWQCAGCAISLFYWQAKKRLKTFSKLLNAATMGVGLLRRKDHLRQTQYFLLGFFGFGACVFSLYHLLGNYASPGVINIPYPWKSFLWLDQLQPFSLVVFLYSAFSWFLAHVLLASYYGFLVAEMHSLNSDIGNDSNLYQVAVLRHYALIFRRLTHLNRHVNATFGPLVTVTAISSYLILVMHSVIFIVASDRMRISDIVFSTVSMVFAGSYLSAFGTFAIKLRNQGKHFFSVVHDIVSIDWNLDSEYQPVAACVAIYGKPVQFGVAFGRTWIVTGRGLVKVILTTVCVVFVALFKATSK